MLLAIGNDVDVLYKSIDTVVAFEDELVATIVFILYKVFDDAVLVITAETVAVAAYAVVFPMQLVAFSMFGADTLASEN
jgi:hypothetical protein